jgi:ubiquinone/menaquinone biosynthesis C-methylase UbiE
VARQRPNPKSRTPKTRGRGPKAEGWHGWDEYAPFYDWENARTLGRRDVAFWRNVARNTGGRVLELGCGTGRIAIPLGRAGVSLVGIDRSQPMLDRARTRIRRARLGDRVQLIRGDIRHLPFLDTTHGARPPIRLRTTCYGGQAIPGFSLVLAPYGILQSLLHERDLKATLEAVHRVLEPGGTFGMELVADLPSWKEYSKRVSLKGWRGRAGGSHVTLVETVRQDRARKLTIFDQTFTERPPSASLRRASRRRARTHRFALTFRTLTVPQMTRRLAQAGFAVGALLGDYRGGPWDPRAEVWVILARKC